MKATEVTQHYHNTWNGRDSDTIPGTVAIPTLSWPLSQKTAHIVIPTRILLESRPF
jgi:hypothetical protein